MCVCTCVIALNQGVANPYNMSIAGNLKLIMLFQLFTRLITFLMNNFIARQASATYLGLISMKLDLLGNTIMSLSRDGIRIALLRQKDEKDRNRAGGLIIIITIIVGLICTGISLKFTTEPVIVSVWPHFRQAVCLYFIAIVLESLTEISTINLISSGKNKEKIMIESLALIGRVSYITYNISMTKNDEAELILLLDCFSKGQLIYAILLNILHLKYQTNKFSISLPSKQLSNLCFSLTRQNFFKYFLSQGDLFIISSFSSLKDQGVYSIISNYGSLVLRLIMQPIEEASLQFFSRELSKNNNNAKHNVTAYFKFMLKFMVYFGLLFICYGSFFTDPVISLLLGSKWTIDNKAANALSAYCWLVAAAGVSGFLESFVSAVIEEDEMKLQRKISIVSSLIYCTLAIGLILWKGSVGLIAASSINFVIRACANAFIIETYSKKRNFQFKWPKISQKIFTMFIMSFMINLALFLMKRFDLKLRISIGIVLLSINVLVILKNDKEILINLKNHLKS